MGFFRKDVCINLILWKARKAFTFFLRKLRGGKGKEKEIFKGQMIFLLKNQLFFKK